MLVHLHNPKRDVEVPGPLKVNDLVGQLGDRQQSETARHQHPERRQEQHESGQLGADELHQGGAQAGGRTAEKASELRAEELLTERLRAELGDAISFDAPKGGMFFWARLTGGRDAGAFAQRAIEKLVAFVPGAPFFAHDPDLSTLRLSFATADVAKIEEGIARLGQSL